MQRVEIKLWNGRLCHPETVQVIRRKIAGAIKSGHTALIDFEGCKHLTPDIVLQIIDGWDDAYVKIATCGREKL